MKKTESNGTYRTSEVCRLANVTLRQLQWWDERRIISPVMEGHARVYKRSEVLDIMVIAELRRKGFSLQGIRKVLRFMQRELESRTNNGPRTVIMGKREPLDLYILANGVGVNLEDSPERILALMKESRVPMHLVSVSDQLRRLEGKKGV